MGRIDGDLIPFASGASHLGIDAFGQSAFDISTLNPFGNIHVVSGILHDPLYGGSGVIRFNQELSALDFSRNGGLDFDILPTSGQIVESIREVGTGESRLSGTSFPTTGLFNGRKFFRTDLGAEFTYFENLGNKWLGELESDGAGRNGTQSNNAYLRRYNGMVMNGTLGIEIPYDITIVGFTWRHNTSSATGNYAITRNGTVVSTVANGGANAGSNTGLNVDFDANANLAFRWQDASASVTSPQVRVLFRRRAV